MELFVECRGSAPEMVVLNLDAMDVPLHGRQEGRFYHHHLYREHYCLPVLDFCSKSPVLVRLRNASKDLAVAWERNCGRLFDRPR